MQKTTLAVVLLPQRVPTPLRAPATSLPSCLLSSLRAGCTLWGLDAWSPERLSAAVETPLVFPPVPAAVLVSAPVSGAMPHKGREPHARVLGAQSPAGLAGGQRGSHRTEPARRSELSTAQQLPTDAGQPERSLSVISFIETLRAALPLQLPECTLGAAFEIFFCSMMVENLFA